MHHLASLPILWLSSVWLPPVWTGLTNFLAFPQGSGHKLNMIQGYTYMVKVTMNDMMITNRTVWGAPIMQKSVTL